MSVSRRHLLSLPLLASCSTTLRAEPDEHKKARKLPRNPKDLEELTQAYQALLEEVSWLTNQLSHLSRTSPPVGSVTAFAGMWLPIKDDRTRWTEAEIGWLLCDGRKITGKQYAVLRAVLGANTLPDYRGYFLRGADNGANRDPARSLGSLQTDSTKLPITPFVSDDQGEHAHDAEGHAALAIDDGGVARFPKELKTSKGTPSCLDFSKIKKEGMHHHTISKGGDSETRPINVAVHWIIKFK